MMTYPVRRSSASAVFEAAFGASAAPVATRWAPPVTVTETEQEFVVLAEVPGMTVDQISVEVIRNVVTISGEKAGEAEADGAVRYTTRRSGSFGYRAQLPGEVAADEVTASLENGVLRVLVPKVTPPSARKVTIEAI